MKPRTIWFTGLSGSGKTTLALEIAARLTAAGRASLVLDGDIVRHGLSRDLGFSQADRNENIRRVAEVARLANDHGIITITALISPMRADRAMARWIIGRDKFTEIFLDVSVAVCEARDPKGLYIGARAGRVKSFTGVSAPYEHPDGPDIVVRTDLLDIKKSADIVMKGIA